MCKTIIALKKPQKNLFWFIPYALLRSVAMARRADAVHLSDAVLAVIGFAVWRFSHRTIFMTVHGLDLTYAQQNRVYALYLRLFLNKHEWRYICNSRATERIARQFGLVHTTVIPPGFDGQTHKESLPPRNKARAWLAQQVDRPLDDVVVLLTVGRLVPRKGVGWFIQQVLPRLEANVLYLVVGAGTDRPRLEHAISGQGLSHRALLLGQLPAASLQLVYAASDIFVMPTIAVPADIEGFGIVGLEAAASALPVVASRLGGISDAIADKRNGLLVAPSDVSAFLDVLQALITDVDYRQSLGRQAQEFTVHRYSWNAMAERYHTYFSQGVLR